MGSYRAPLGGGWGDVSPADSFIAKMFVFGKGFLLGIFRSSASTLLCWLGVSFPSLLFESRKRLKNEAREDRSSAFSISPSSYHSGTRLLRESQGSKLRSFQESPTTRSTPSSKRWWKTRRRMEWGRWRKTERCCYETKGRWRSWKPNSTRMTTVSLDLLKCPVAAAALVLFHLFSASTLMILTDLDVFQCFFFNTGIYNTKNSEIYAFYSGDRC